MPIVLAILEKIWGFLGWRGLVILALLVYIGVTYVWIKEDGEKITNLQTINQQLRTANTDMANKINEQNDAILEAGRKYNDAQQAINKAESDNAALVEKYNKIKTVVITKPIAQTCPDSVQEIKDTLRPLAHDWNAQ